MVVLDEIGGCRLASGLIHRQYFGPESGRECQKEEIMSAFSVVLLARAPAVTVVSGLLAILSLDTAHAGPYSFQEYIGDFIFEMVLLDNAHCFCRAISSCCFCQSSGEAKGLKSFGEIEKRDYFCLIVSPTSESGRIKYGLGQPCNMNQEMHVQLSWQVYAWHFLTHHSLQIKFRLAHQLVPCRPCHDSGHVFGMNELLTSCIQVKAKTWPACSGDHALSINRFRPKR
jgi:hypothetical protein